MMASDYIIWFEAYEEEHRPRVGGKNASLGTMMKAGLPVPPGFAVTTDAFEILRTHTETRARVNHLLQRIDLTDPIELRQIASEIRKLIEEIPMDQGVEDQIRHAYQVLCERCGLERIPVAVRSSATAEDLPNASFAGQQDTYLWVMGEAAVIDHVKKCWSSLFTDRAIAYRHEMGFDDEIISMSVAVQKMVDPKAAGVAFTLNPSNGDRSQVAIDASWGLGEAVVGGEVTPDNYLVDKVIKEIVGRIISPKTIEYRVTDSDSVEKVEVEEERQLIQCLTDDEIKAVAAMARRAERYYGKPQDLEWAIDRHLPPGENVLLLQARPETVWSRKAAVPISQPEDNLTSIVATLLSPIHARETKPTDPKSTTYPASK
ncbi:MAG TPA: PEP/pyruvate-binding domain-containing protein [Acidimicrobiia bacterium]|nr:PEP/pyruvate-binding domain-containing protein [Acidimicrobiia bacterium]